MRDRTGESSASDVCVVGGGIVGLAAAFTLRERGVDVVCMERAVAGDGQSAGRTRQFRHLHADPELTALAIESRPLWQRWEAEFGLTLLGDEGAVRAGAEPTELSMLRAAGVPAELVDGARAHELLPIAAPIDGPLLWDPLAGALRGQDAIGALAARLGRSLQRREVSAIQVAAGDGSVSLTTSAGTHACARCIICAGAGTDRLVRPLGIDLRQRRRAHLRLAFRAAAAPATPLACFSDRRPSVGDVIYALSDLDDRYAVGLSTLTTYPRVDGFAIDVPPSIGLTTQRRRIVDYVRAHLPGLRPDPVDEVLRLTTTLREDDQDGFEVWDDGPVIVIAGHNLFKFAPLLGERLADGAAGGLPMAGIRACGLPAAGIRCS